MKSNLDDTSCMVHESVAKYRGIGKNTGRLKFEVDDQKMWGDGALFTIDRDAGIGVDLSMPVVSSPSYQPSQYQDVHFRCECSSTGKLFLFVGRLETNFFKDSTPPRNELGASKNVPALCTESKTPTHPSATLTTGSVAGKTSEFEVQKSVSPPKRDHMDALMAECKVIAAQRAAGLDPDLRMAFIPIFVGESRANLYRKIGLTFPAPKKRGRGSFWSMSQIEAYMAASHA